LSVRRAATALIAVLTLIWAGSVTVVAQAAGQGPRVTVTNGALTLDGAPWWPTGFNAYELGTNWAVNKGCGAQVDLDAYFGSLPPRSVTRFNAFASLATNKRTGVQDFRALDSVFTAAERHGQLLVAVLTAGDGACEDGVFKDRDWYAGGWKADTSSDASYARWIDTAVSRWGRSSALAGWELVGEPETSRCGDAACGWQQRTCPPGAAATLRSFFDAAGARLHALDQDTPIWAGLAGGGQCGSAGDDYSLVAGSPSIDILDVHDYGSAGSPSATALSGDQFNGVQRRLQQAKVVGKPLVVAEVGKPAGSCGPLSERATYLTQKVQTQRRAGSAGVLFWAFVPDPRLSECTMDIGPGDPLFHALTSIT
jgi:mannan endo-1,4-beta-mannosidase